MRGAAANTWHFGLLLVLLLALPSLGMAATKPDKLPAPKGLKSAQAAPPALIKWYVDIKSDAIGKRTLEARVANADGFRVRLYLRKNKAIWGELKLPYTQNYGFHEQRMPVLRVDSNSPYMLDELAGLEMGFKRNLSHVIGKRLRFMIWNSGEPGFIPPLLAEMMRGESLNITYALSSGSVELATIPLTRANEAIAKFLNVLPLKQAADRAARDIESFEAIARRHVAFCDDLRFSGDDTDYGSCRRVFVNCSEIPAQTATDFQKCLARQ